MEARLRPWVWRGAYAGVGLLFGTWIGVSIASLAGWLAVEPIDWPLPT